MSTTVYEKMPDPGGKPNSPCEISFTRFFGGKGVGECVQITLADGLNHKWASLTFQEFKDAFIAVFQDVELNKESFWNTLNKEK